VISPTYRKWALLPISAMTAKYQRA